MCNTIDDITMTLYICPLNPEKNSNSPSPTPLFPIQMQWGSDSRSDRALSHVSGQ
jgi:hypothetical protein